MKNLYLFGVSDTEKKSFFVTLIQEVMIREENEQPKNIQNFMRFVGSDRFVFPGVNEIITEYLGLFKCNTSGPLRKIED